MPQAVIISETLQSPEEHTFPTINNITAVPYNYAVEGSNTPTGELITEVIKSKPNALPVISIYGVEPTTPIDNPEQTEGLNLVGELPDNSILVNAHFNSRNVGYLLGQGENPDATFKHIRPEGSIPFGEAVVDVAALLGLTVTGLIALEQKTSRRAMLAGTISISGAVGLAIATIPLVEARGQYLNRASVAEADSISNAILQGHAVDGLDTSLGGFIQEFICAYKLAMVTDAIGAQIQAETNPIMVWDTYGFDTGRQAELARLLSDPQKSAKLYNQIVTTLIDNRGSIIKYHRDTYYRGPSHLPYTEADSLAQTLFDTALSQITTVSVYQKQTRNGLPVLCETALRIDNQIGSIFNLR